MIDGHDVEASAPGLVALSARKTRIETFVLNG
jgi:hypothetical protein